jgi:hypothetical protein
MTTTFGDPLSFAIAADIDEHDRQRPDLTLGRAYAVVQGEPLGHADDVVALALCVGAFEGFLRDGSARMNPSLARAPAHFAFDEVHHAVWGNSPGYLSQDIEQQATTTAEMKVRTTRCLPHVLAPCGSLQFDGFSAIAIDSELHTRLLWKARGKRLHDVELPRSTVEEALTRFTRWFRAETGWEPRAPKRRAAR